MKTNPKLYINFTYSFLIILIVFAGLSDVMVFWNVSVTLLFAWGILLFPIKLRKKNTRVVIYLVLSIILFSLSIIISSSYESLIRNIRSSLYSLCAAGLLVMINGIDNTILYEKLINNIVSFNVVLAINNIALFIQSKGIHFLIRNKWLMENPFYEDHCAGLFGYNATNVLGLYSVFVMILNLSYISQHTKYKKRILLFTVLTQSIMAYLSQYNDNMGYYIILTFFLSLCFIVFILHNNGIKKKLKSIFKYMAIVCVITMTALNLPFLGDYLKRKVYDRARRIVFFNSFGDVTGSGERLAIVQYALKQKKTWAFGEGVGSTFWIEGGWHGFRHFGVSSIGSYILLGGIWFYLSYMMLYAELYYSLFNNREKRDSLALRVLSIFIVVLFSIYTTIFNDVRTVVLIGLIVALLSKQITRTPTIPNTEYGVELNENR